MSFAGTVIIGAGPYGLSLAAHLAAQNLDHRIFGKPLQFWSQLVAAGGERYLKSFCFGTDIATPAPGLSFADYSRPRGLETYEPCSIKDFADYGLWFKERHVNWVETLDFVNVARSRNGFALTLENGELVTAARVVVATGLSGFARVPPEVGVLGSGLVQHTSTIERFSDYRGFEVAVIGAGQSALEAAALLREAGAKPQLIIREPSVSWMCRSSQRQTLLRRIRSPVSTLGTGPKAWALTKFPGLMHLVPAPLRTRFVKTHLPPEGAWWLRPRVEHLVPVHCGTKVVSARETRGRAALTLHKTDTQAESEITVDRVVVGTGYGIDVDRLDFLDPALSHAVGRIGGAPRLNAGFESSVKGLYFVGPASAMSFGPLFRFVAGTAYTSKTVSRHLALISAR